MNSELKIKLLKAIENVLDEITTDPDEQKKFENIFELKNITNIIENYEEYLPDIKLMMNKKANKDKWR